MIMYAENLKDCTKDLLELITEFNNVPEYKVLHKSITFHTSNKHFPNNIKKWQYL